MKRNEGFTLIELLVTFAAGSLVTLAAVTLLLLGARVQYKTTQEAKEQQTVRIVMSVLEDMAGSGDIKKIEGTDTGWQLKDKNGNVLFEYTAGSRSIYQGEAEREKEPLLTGLNNAGVVMEGKVMRLSFETDSGANYVTRVYCRMGVEDVPLADEEAVDGMVQEQKPETQGELDLNTAGGRRWNFLNTLAEQYVGGQNTGQIVGGNGEYYSEWYIGEANWGKNGWNKDTPWCACFVSWAAMQDWSQENGVSKNAAFKFANVDDGMARFKNQSLGGQWKTSAPEPGDYIFFDWTGERKDPAHVGVVLDVAVEGEATYVYTIEGNSSGRVAVRKYQVTDPVIMGYGVLPGFEA